MLSACTNLRPEHNTTQVDCTGLVKFKTFSSHGKTMKLVKYDSITNKYFSLGNSSGLYGWVSADVYEKVTCHK